MEGVLSCAIHPAIGIARVGNSVHSFFVGPEIPGTSVQPDGGFKDPGQSDSVKRQAARFRIFAYGHDGLIGELTAKDADITWRVELANTKAEWDEFDGVRGEDLPLDSRRDRREWRNRDVAPSEREALKIVPGARELSGPQRRAIFDGGKLFGVDVLLGEARTDADGRLLVLGGQGVSGTVEEGRQIAHYANNDRWYDDIADGPVEATVTFPDGTVLQAKSAWVLTAPPDFSPETTNVVTLWDVALDTAIESSRLSAPVRPSFTHDILPIVERALAIQWTSNAAADGHSRWDGKYSLEELASSEEEHRVQREAFFTVIRNPDLDGAAAVDQANKNFMPPLAGDHGDCEEGKPDTWLAVTSTQYRLLGQWADGDFEADLGRAPRANLGITPEGLDRAALEACSGGAFYPGIEGGWIFRKVEAYSEPFRFDRSKLRAGDVTKRMAVPWQADFFECNTWWWPAQRPDDVLPMQAYARLKEIDELLADDDLGHQGSDKIVREQLTRESDTLLRTRVPWARDLPPRSYAGDNAMVTGWKKLGFVTSVLPSGEPANVRGRRVLVETEVALSHRIGAPQAFHRLVNIERHPDFRPIAREIALDNLARADFSDPYYRPFPYSVEALRERLDKIYNAFVAEIDKPYWLHSYPRAAVVENLRQKAPMNLTDGAWLHHVLSAGPIDDVRAKLFGIWSDEAGNGRSELNHCNVYDNLLRSLDIYMPPISSRVFIEQDLLPSAYENPAFQLAIGLFPDEFLPELLGMTLYLEWEATPTMLPVAQALRQFNIDPQFYAMHAAIDNPTAGHGALARQAVELHLAKVATEGGESALQREWQRVWRGYVAWATVGNFAQELREHLNAAYGPNGGDGNARARMLALVRRKASYARTAHGDVSLGGTPLNALFDEPEKLLDVLVARGWVDPERPRDSRFVTELLGFHGPMYKVFDVEEMDTLLDWIGSLHSGGSPDPRPDVPAERVKQILGRYSGDARAEPRHGNFDLPTADGGRRSVADWFSSQDLDGLMAALANSQYVVAGKPEESPLITEVFGSLMRGVLSADEVNAFHDWIKAGCPAAGEQFAALEHASTLMRRFTTEGVREPALDRLPFAHRRAFIGTGAVH